MRIIEDDACQQHFAEHLYKSNLCKHAVQHQHGSRLSVIGNFRGTCQDAQRTTAATVYAYYADAAGGTYLIVHLHKGDFDHGLPVNCNVNLLKDLMQCPGGDAAPGKLLGLTRYGVCFASSCLWQSIASSWSHFQNVS